MTGQDFADKLDQIYTDLTTTAKGKTVEILFRKPNNTTEIFELSSTSGGVVNQAQFDALETFIDGLKPIANTYESERQPVTDALEVVSTERAGHQVLIDAAEAARLTLNASQAYLDAQSARTALTNALAADSGYQNAVIALESAKNDVNYVDAVESYRSNNVVENFGNLSDARGKYID